MTVRELEQGVIGGFASEGDALSFWARLRDRERYAVYEVNIGFTHGAPAQRPVCWLVLTRGVTQPKLEGTT